MNMQRNFANLGLISLIIVIVVNLLIGYDERGG